MKYIFLFLCLIFYGCSFSVWEPIQHNTVSFGPGFTEHQRKEIMEGFRLWNRETQGRITFVEVPNNGSYVVILGSEAEAAREDAFTNQHLKPHQPPHFTIGLTQPDHNITWMFMDRIERSAIDSGEDSNALIRQTAAHEAGHELGLIHVPQQETALMNPESNKDVVNNLRLTKYDINQFCQYWGCVNENPALPLEK